MFPECPSSLQCYVEKNKTLVAKRKKSAKILFIGSLGFIFSGFANVFGDVSLMFAMAGIPLSMTCLSVYLAADSAL